MMFWKDRNRLQILLLQLQKHRPVLYVSTDGELGRKGRRRAKGLTEDIKSEVASTINTGYETDFLRLKLLPMNAVSDFASRMEKTFDLAQQWLNEELGRHFW